MLLGMKKIIGWIRNLFVTKTIRHTRYLINGKEVSEAEWYANGGLEVEEELSRMERQLDKWFK
jgi:hypothetical protein